MGAPRHSGNLGWVPRMHKEANPYDYLSPRVALGGFSSPNMPCHRCNSEILLAAESLIAAHLVGGQLTCLYLIDFNGGRDRTRTCDLLRVKHYGLVRFIEASGT